MTDEEIWHIQRAVRALRAAHRLTVDDLVEMCGVGRNTMHTICRCDRRVSEATCNQVLEGLGMTKTELGAWYARYLELLIPQLERKHERDAHPTR